MSFEFLYKSKIHNIYLTHFYDYRIIFKCKNIFSIKKMWNSIFFLMLNIYSFNKR